MWHVPKHANLAEIPFACRFRRALELVAKIVLDFLDRSSKPAPPRKLLVWFKCPICIHHQHTTDNVPEMLEYVKKHNVLYYHKMEGM